MDSVDKERKVLKLVTNIGDGLWITLWILLISRHNYFSHINLPVVLNKPEQVSGEKEYIKLI